MSDLFAPTPYSAEQIRAACPAGTRLVFDVAEGEEQSVLHIDFVQVDERGAQTVSQTVGGDPSEPSPATWEELRDHARFPQAQTTMEDGEADVPAGRFAITRYVVRDENGRTTVFEFAKDASFAGPPVRMEVRTPAGDVVYRMALRERTSFGDSAD